MRLSAGAHDARGPVRPRARSRPRRPAAIAPDVACRIAIEGDQRAVAGGDHDHFAIAARNRRRRSACAAGRPAIDGAPVGRVRGAPPRCHRRRQRQTAFADWPRPARSRPRQRDRCLTVQAARAGTGAAGRRVERAACGFGGRSRARSCRSRPSPSSAPHHRPDAPSGDRMPTAPARVHFTIAPPPSASSLTWVSRRSGLRSHRALSRCASW
jgi:hypothetical protein